MHLAQKIALWEQIKWSYIMYMEGGLKIEGCKTEGLLLYIQCVHDLYACYHMYHVWYTLYILCLCT